MKTHFPRERAAEAAPAASKALGWRNRRVSVGSSHGGRTIQFIHSCPPHPHVYLLLLSPHSLYTHCLFSKKANQLRTTHPLSHIITRPLWKCASLQTLDVTTGRSPQAERSCRNKRGLVMAAKESHPTHNYYYPRPIHSLQMPL